MRVEGRPEVVGEGSSPDRWLLTHAERGNPATDVDRRHPGGQAWSRGNLVRPLIDGRQYFRRLQAELADTDAGDQIYLAAWVGDQTERLRNRGPTIGAQLARVLGAGVSVNALFWCPRTWMPRATSLRAPETSSRC